MTNAWTTGGGAERVLFTLLAALDRRRFQPVVFSLFDAKGRPGYSEAAEALGIPVWRFRMTPEWSLRFVGEVARFFVLVRRGRFAALHASGDMGLGLLAGRLTRIPIRLTTVHDAALDRRPLDHWVRLASVRWLATTSVAISHAVAESLCARYGARSAKIVVILNGVDDLFLLGVPAGDADVTVAADQVARIVTVARLAPEKGIDVLLTAASQMLTQGAHFELHIVGDGPSRDDLLRQASALGLDSCTEFHGQAENVGANLRDADIFVLPSRSEGLGIAAIEAMAAGLPVVAAAVGGVPEVVVDGVTGVLVHGGTRGADAFEPDPTEMARAILRLVQDPVLARSMGEEGRRRYEARFTARAFATRYEALYVVGRN